MKRRILIAQVVYVVSLSNLITINIMGDDLVTPVRLTAIILSIFLLLASIATIIIFSFSFINKINMNEVSLSSHLTPLFKFIFSGLSISGILILFQLGLIYNNQLLVIALILIALLMFPTIIMLRAVYVTIDESRVLFYNFFQNHESIHIPQINRISRVTFGAEYKIEFMDTSNKKRVRYFYPKGGFVFFEPSSVKMLRERMNNDKTMSSSL